MTSEKLRGRRRIYTDYAEVTADNVIEVVQDALRYHMDNMGEMSFLLDYDKGIQPLKRTKTVRKDINIEVSDNVANQITTFKCGYVWGNPILYVQRGQKDLGQSEEDVNRVQDNGVTMLNEMNDIEYAQTKDQELARFVEITGVGYQMVDIKYPYDRLSVFDLVTLNPLYTFCIYRNSVKQEKVAGVTFRKTDSGDRYFTVITPKERYEILNLVRIVNGRKVEEWRLDETYEANPFGRVNIVEFNRSSDRTGCFERQISDMDALNIEVSDFANNVAQTTQEIWWGNDFEFQLDDSGNPKPPVSGQWLLTSSQGGGTPKVEALHSGLELSSVQENIVSKRNLILQKCYVPLQSEPGGGSTGSAMSMSSGWAAAEAAASIEEQMLFRSKMEVAILEIIAINMSPDIKEDSPLKTLVPSDIKPQFTRNKTYDLISKVNAMVTMIKSGIHGRVAMDTVDLFPDVAQAWADSREVIEKYQTAIINRAENTYVSAYTKLEDAERSQGDLSDQADNSPIINGMKMGQRVQMTAPEHRTGGDV